MAFPSVEPVTNTWKRSAIFLSAAFATALLYGCGKREEGFVPAYELLGNAALRFYETGKPLVFASKEELRQFVSTQVARLDGPSWKQAWNNLLLTGPHSIDPLISILDDTSETSAVATALPGSVTPGQKIFLSKGEVAYALLREIIGNLSNYKGPLPGHDKGKWETWWRANHKTISIKTAVSIQSARR